MTSFITQFALDYGAVWERHSCCVLMLRTKCNDEAHGVWYVSDCE